MPGKYSHGLVLAQYSSQGIISLPNDDYLGSAAQRRNASAAVSRQRTTSNATKSSGHQAAQSVQYARSTPHSRIYNLTPSSTRTPQKRVVIVQSDSEEEHDLDESEEEWVRPQPRSSQRFTPSTHAKTSGPRISGTPLRQSTTRATEKPIQDISFTQQAPTESRMPKNRSGGVRALIEARHKAEMEKASTNTTSEREPGKGGLLLREFLQNPPKPSAPAEKPLTVQEFLQRMPAPDADADGDGVTPGEVSKAAVSSEIPPIAQSDHRIKPNKGDHSPAYRWQDHKNLGKTDLARTTEPRPHEMEPDFGTFTDAEEGAHFPFPVTSAPVRDIRSLQKVTRRVRDEKPDKMATKMTRSSSHIPTEVDDGRRVDTTPRLQNSLVRETKPQKKQPSRVRSESSLSSLDSQGSSIFGMSSIGGTTQATSGYLITPRNLNKTAYQRDWDLPRVRHGEHDDSFDDILQSMKNMTASSTSHEGMDDEDHGFAAPRLPSTSKNELPSRRQWGTISTGRSTSARAREVDEMSETSAVFPPDIGRYKYEGEGTSPLTMAFAAMSHEADRPYRFNSLKGKTKKGGKETGLLRKLKKKATK